jgi:NAD(P)-dependent dehydrogenase (short-subunit alcohol dehydrogenase family)
MTTPVPAPPFADPAPAQRLEQAAAALRSHGFAVEILDDAAAARARVKDLIPEGVSVFTGASERAVRGALPYATANAGIEGLTRALAVDYGPRGIRVNAVALGSIATERHHAFLGSQQPAAAHVWWLLTGAGSGRV